MKILFFLIFMLCISSLEVHSQNSMGCLKENYDTNMVKKKKYTVSRGDGLPSSYSLLPYAPSAGSQGSLGSCTSWASAYAGLTIVKRIEKNDSYAQPYSPLDLHNRLKVKYNEPPCSYGNQIYNALQMLKENGCDIIDYNGNYCKYEPSSKFYNDKLFDFDLLNLSTYDFKSSLKENAPIVICMTSYNNGWNNSSNIINGIWNGIHGNKTGEFHAMCIIGYDDFVGGGSFLVQNSWGEYWGKNGRFWLKYSDLYHITHAYSLHSASKNYNNNLQNKQRSFEAKYFRLYNQCSIRSYLAVTKRINGYWNSVGWYAVEPGGHVDYYIGDRDAEEIYWIATAEKNKLWWNSTAYAAKSFCCDPVFRFNKNDYEYCSKSNTYFYYNPETMSSGEICSQSISCPDYYNTRGENGSVSGKVSSLQFDNRNTDTANIFWKKGFFLFDFSTAKMIEPLIDENEALVYDIWYIDEKNIATNKKCNAGELEKLHYRKFMTKENALKWAKYEK